MLTDPLEASPRQAAETLGELERLRRTTRRSLGAPWYPLVCFGVLTVLSAPVVAAAGTVSLAPFWVFGSIVGMLLIRRHYRRRGDRRGVTSQARRVWPLAWGMLAGCMAGGVIAGVASGPAVGVLVPIVVVLGGYALLGWMAHDPIPSLALTPGAALAVAFALAGVAPWLVELTFGAVLLGVGAGLRAARRRW